MSAKAKKQEVKQEEVQQKEKTMELYDLKNAKLVIEATGEIEIERTVMWDNSNGRQGIIKKCYMNLTVTGKNGKQRFVIGSDQFIWMGKPIKNSSEKQVIRA